MNRILFFITIGVLIVTSLRVAAVTAQGPVPQGAQASLGSGFTYQGQLKNGGAPYSGACNMQFSLWDAQGAGSPPTGGTQVGSTHSVNGVTVTASLFKVIVNSSGQFGQSAFNGQERWLQVAVQCGSDSGFEEA